MKRIAAIMLASILLLVLTSCDIGLGIVKVELNSFPDNIVYYVGESDSIDLTGATIITTVLQGSSSERPISQDEFLEITDNVNFSVSGVYEVIIRRNPGGDKDNNYLVARVPVQVIEREVGFLEEK